MNDDTKKKYTIKKFNKEIKIKDGDNSKTFRVSLAEAKDVNVKKEDGKKVPKDDTPAEETIKVKILEVNEANKDKLKDVNKNGDEKDMEVVWKKGTWSPHFEIKKLDTKEVQDANKTTLGVKGNMYIWPTWTLIGILILIGVALISWLIYSLVKKDDSSEE